MQKIVKKNLIKKTLWTFERLEMGHIFISPYPNHFWCISNFDYLNMYVKLFSKMVFLHMIFKISLITTM
jgi:hypothetical protein